MFYAFEYWSGPKTTNDIVNKRTGQRNIAGAAYAFESKLIRDRFVSLGKVTPGMGSNCRVAVTKSQLRKLRQGYSKKDFDYFVDSL